MPREKRPLIADDTLDFEEETCRAVKRLHITADSLETTQHQTEPVNPSSPGAANGCIATLTDNRASRIGHGVRAGQGAALDDASHIPQGKGRQPICLTEHDVSSPVRSTPQRSLSSPDMSRFKFRLCLSKPPIHPTSSGKIRRQLSLEETSIDDDGALAKSTSDRHCEQERLFHQLDQKLTLDLPNAAATFQPDSQPSGPFPILLGASQHTVTSSSPHWSAAIVSPSEAQSRVASGQMTATTVGSTADEHDEMRDSGSEGDVCQPSTPIRREDSISLREDNQSLLGEAMFAAMYEQTNILLRNLHFERINRRVSTN